MRPFAALAAGMVTVTASGLGTVLMETLMPFASGPVLVAPMGTCPGQVVRSLPYSSLRVASVIEASRRLKVMTKLLDASKCGGWRDGCAAHARVAAENPFEAVGEAVAIRIGIEGGGRAAETVGDGGPRVVGGEVLDEFDELVRRIELELIAGRQVVHCGEGRGIQAAGVAGEIVAGGGRRGDRVEGERGGGDAEVSGDDEFVGAARVEVDGEDAVDGGRAGGSWPVAPTAPGLSVPAAPPEAALIVTGPFTVPVPVNVGVPVADAPPTETALPEASEPFTASVPAFTVVAPV